MKHKLAVILIVAMAVLAVAITGCDLFSISVQKRLDSFLADLNSSDRSGIYQNFHPTETEDYAAIRNKTYPDWSTLFPIGENYSYVNLNTVNPASATCRIEGDTIGYDVVFVMTLDGVNWQINDLYLDAVLTVQ